MKRTRVSYCYYYFTNAYVLYYYYYFSPAGDTIQIQVRDQAGEATTFKVKKSTKFEKIFAACKFVIDVYCCFFAQVAWLTKKKNIKMRKEKALPLARFVS